MTDGGCYGPQCDVYSAGCVIYSLLSGFYPFDADTADEFEAIVKARPADAPAPIDDFPEEWGGVSAEAKEFIQALMQHDPLKRPTAAEALKMAWIKDGPAKAAGQQKGAAGGAGKLGWKSKTAGAGAKASGSKAVTKLSKMATMRKGCKHTHIAKKDHVCTMSSE
jgi:hypothetical protein